MRVKLRFEFGDDLRLGPGKAELLERIGTQGSIAAAGRSMGMSYKRAWSLIDEMNRAFAQPVVHSARGGAGHGGAELTETGHAVIAHFRALERLVTGPEGQAEIAAIDHLLRAGLGEAKSD